jgi:hypothetical protein
MTSSWSVRVTCTTYGLMSLVRDRWFFKEYITNARVESTRQRQMLCISISPALTLHVFYGLSHEGYKIEIKKERLFTTTTTAKIERPEVRDGRRTPVLCKITNETGATVWRLLSLLISLWDMIFLLRVYKKGSSWRCTRQTQLCISIPCEPLQNSSFLYSPLQNRLSLYVITLQFLTILCHRR